MHRHFIAQDSLICNENICISTEGHILVISGDSCYSDEEGKFVNIHNPPPKGDFKKLCPSPSGQTEFSVIKYSSGTCFGPCPAFSIEIDSNGSFLYSGGSFAQAPHICRGRLAEPFINWLKYFLDQCKWRRLEAHYNPKVNISDMVTEYLFISFPDDPSYSMTNYANSAPKELSNLTSYLYDIGRLLDLHYLRRGTESGEHYFISDLEKCKDMEDSIRYMIDFDSIKYKLPGYPEGLDIIRKTISANIDKTLNPYAYNLLDVGVDYAIYTDGTIKIIRDYILSDTTKKVPLNIQKDLTHAFSSLKNATPGVFNGKEVIVKRTLSVMYDE